MLKIWIDLSNSPHPLLFAPVVKELQAEGHSVLLTARDNAQTVELAMSRWPDVAVIGGPSPRGLAAKARTLGGRVEELRRWARARRPDVALSHNSYAQIVAARAARVPVVTAMDYEFQPANHLAFRLADAILMPKPLADGVLRRQGATSKKTRPYPGLKEELYLGDFEPDPSVLRGVGIERSNDQVVVVARTPPERASYHRMENAVFWNALQVLGGQPKVRCVALARHPEQREALAKPEFGSVVVPPSAVDSRSLLHAADLVLGAGGTMTREAALLGIPTYSVFAGKRPLADRWLEERGLLRQLEDPEQLAEACPREREPASLQELRERGADILRTFVDATVRTARRS